MSSVSALTSRNLLSKGVIGQVGDDLGALFSLKYQGTGSVTSVIVTTATDITMITSDGGTDAYTWAAYTTIGALVDAINADGIFVAKILDCISTTATGSGLAIAGTLAVNSIGEYSVMSDTSNADFLGYRLSFDRTLRNSPKFAMSHRVHLREIITDLTLGGGADANTFVIYETTPAFRGRVETAIYTKTPTTGSISTTNWASGNGKITAADGNDLVIMISDATSVAGTITVSGEVE